MKNVLIIAIVAIIFSGCGMNNSGQGGRVDGGMTNQNNPLIDPDFYYEIDTWGTNADVFEFTPRSNPDYTCVNVGGGSSRALQCFPKQIKKGK